MWIENHNIKIKSIGAAVSNHWQSNLEYGGVCGDAKIQKFIKKIGVKGKYLAGPRQTASDLCVAAAQKILKESQVPPGDIGVVVFVTQSADYRDPSGAAVIQHRLGISENCIAFDVNLGCSGFVCGLAIVGALLHNSASKYALLLCGETAARERDPQNPRLAGHADTLLFGDAGTATLIEANDKSDGILVSAMTDGNRFHKIIVPYGFYRNPAYPQESSGDVYMDEIEVFNFSTAEVPLQINDYMEKRGTKPEDYDYLALHQANKFIMDRIVKQTGFQEEQYLVSIDRYGNTSSASIPLTLVDKLGESDGRKEVRILCCGYGVGLSWATAEFDASVESILPLVHTDEFFEDGFAIN